LNDQDLNRRMAPCLHMNISELVSCLSLIMVVDGKSIQLLRFFWPISIGQCLGEGARSRLRLTVEPRECYLLIPGIEPLIWNKRGNSGRRTIFGSSATPVRGLKSIGQLDFGPKRRAFVRSRNNFRYIVTHTLQAIFHREK
jgi:hypothetical protein